MTERMLTATERMLTAAQWNHLLRTDRGTAIVEALARYRDRVIELTEPNTDVLLRLRSSLRITRPDADVHPVRIDLLANDACTMLALRMQVALHCEPPVLSGQIIAQQRKMLAHPHIPTPRLRGTSRSDGSFPWDAGVWYLLDLVEAITSNSATDIALATAMVDALYAGNLPINFRSGTRSFIVLTR